MKNIKLGFYVLFITAFICKICISDRDMLDYTLSGVFSLFFLWELLGPFKIKRRTK